MTCDEIFSKLANHMINGLMFHEQMSNFYDFLNLKGYKRCHEYHYIAETMNYRKLCRYYINHYNKLISEVRFENVSVIPSTWYSHVRQDVTPSEKRNYVKEGLEKWVTWERETKKLYQDMHKELLNNGSVASALMLEEFICDVDCELKKAERYHLNKIATGYDIIDIIEEQHEKHEKYKKKMKEIGEKLC